MFCSKCGNKIYDDTGVCRYCGEKYKKTRTKGEKPSKDKKEDGDAKKPKFFIKADIFIIILSFLFAAGAIAISIIQALGREFYFPYSIFLFSAAFFIPCVYFSVRGFLYYFKNGITPHGRNFWNPYNNQSSTTSSGAQRPVNYQNFEKIKIGMPIDEVKGLLGPGKEVFNSRINGIDVLTMMWQDIAVYPLAYITSMPKSITVCFQNGLVTEKTQMGL